MTLRDDNCVECLKQVSEHDVKIGSLEIEKDHLWREMTTVRDMIRNRPSWVVLGIISTLVSLVTFFGAGYLNLYASIGPVEAKLGMMIQRLDNLEQRLKP